MNPTSPAKHEFKIGEGYIQIKGVLRMLAVKQTKKSGEGIFHIVNTPIILACFFTLFLPSPLGPFLPKIGEGFIQIKGILRMVAVNPYDKKLRFFTPFTAS